jgi:hypothetical protein
VGELVVGSSRLRLEIPVSAEQTPGGALRLEGKTTVRAERDAARRQIPLVRESWMS